MRIAATSYKNFLEFRSNTPQYGVVKLPIEPVQQETSASCVAAVLRMLYRYYFGCFMTHAQASVLTKCEPEGAELEVVGSILKKPIKCLRGVGQVRRAIKAGHPIVSDDNETYIDSHAILIHGQTPKGFWFVDPATGSEVWRPDNWFRAASTEFLLLA